MPCDGVSVLTAMLRDRDETVAELLKLIGPAVVQQPKTDKNRVIRMALALPMHNGQLLPVKLAIEPGGRITAITQSGTFEIGKDTLEKWLASLKAQGVNFEGIKFETHHHNHNAPKLAYTTAQQQR